MKSPLEHLRDISTKRRKAVDRATRIAESMKRTAEAAAKAAQETEGKAG